MNNLINIIIKNYYYGKLIGNKGTYVVEEDWDNMIILDACRYDMFKELINIKGKLEYRLSRGSCTNEFLLENFKNKVFKNIVYVTANPLVDYHVPNSFAEIIPVWKEGWSDEFETVFPETMVEYATKANLMHPQKRLIIHFMQPHYPFIGKESREKIGIHDGIRSRNYFFKNKDTNHTTQEVWNLLRDRKIDKKTVWNAYEENLRLVLESVKELISNLCGKTIITSDHGNLFGEWIFPFPIKEYGHPSGIFIKNLVKVPWFIIENGERKKIKDKVDIEKEKIDMIVKKIRAKENLI